MKLNSTKPLPYDNSNNQIYNNPFITTSTRNDDEINNPPNKRSKFCTSTTTTSLASLFNKQNRHKLRRRINSISTNLSYYKFPKQDEFNFNSQPNFASSSTRSSTPSSNSNSDLESLPDLTDDDELTPENTPIKKLPTINFQYLELPTLKPPKFQLHKPRQREISSKISIFEVPEILHKIISFVDEQNSNLPTESTPIRRKPLNYNHAMLIHGDAEIAQRATEEIQEQLQPVYSNPLFNCLLVNKLFFKITSDIISKKFYFSNEENLVKFINYQGPKTTSFQPKIFILHKLFQTRQYLFDKCIHYISFKQLEWFELYMCPKLFPSIEIFKQAGSNLKKLIITGSKTIDDNFLISISLHCKNIEVLDLRACEYISDFSIYQISKHLKNLKIINFGRKNKGHLISDASIIKLINCCKGLNTIGLAGCNVTDKTVFEIAIKLPDIERLSLNNCPRLTDHCLSIFTNPNTIHCFLKLKVLEFRYNSQLDNLQHLIEFKKRQEYKNKIYLLIELCEDLMAKYRAQEQELDNIISMKIFNDIMVYINDDNDGDSNYIDLLNR
ncbi:unnamed protein product [Candida verbasci]|uniref:Antagonist of mitotic exit network protein 1 n=1 Tax=Candida verbasci TaxID=1227364 RepID=A0A9W4XFK6_9ASCO|nr:unnamed protein product [Candida verbasci]